MTGTSTSGGDGLAALDLGNPEQITYLLREVRPDAIIHLAGIQSVSESWEHPTRAFTVNTGGTAALLEAIEREVPETHLVVASSAAVYGEPDSGRPGPFDEKDTIRPESPYGASKAAAEVLATASAARTGLAVAVARLFNQFGPDQPPAQVPAEFAARISEAEAAGEGAVRLEVGNPEVERDYTDVRDTARALQLVIGKRTTGTYNFCSGRTRSLRRVIDGIAELSTIDVQIGTEPGRANRNDVSVFAGSPSRLQAATGWGPQITLEESLAGLLAFRRAKISGGG